ncbi:hypothetical protein ANN_03984 [Periplaneta americana]|uniref:PiggyBac transposable element-derived protein domain-containing protein n=1 Tax=Periplaneta americana TaxID=6978 RepID=A0ABQ8T8V8_PERAM|nr:hypothetical protein ANN_03984 [Periplaneta americana]
MVNNSDTDKSDSDEEDAAAVQPDSDNDIESDVGTSASDTETVCDSVRVTVSTASEKLTAKSGREYVPDPPAQHRRGLENIVRSRVGITNEGKVNNICYSFKKFITEEIVDIIVKHSNEEADRKINIKHTTATEIYGLIGLLIQMGSSYVSKLSTDILWSAIRGRNIYTGTMSRSRFKELISIMRFDDKNTRGERRRIDQFAPLRDVFKKLN